MCVSDYQINVNYCSLYVITLKWTQKHYLSNYLMLVNLHYFILFFSKCCLYFSVVQCLDFLSSGMFVSLAAVSTKVPRSFPHLVPLML